MRPPGDAQDITQDDGGDGVRARWRAYLDALPPAERARLEADLDRLLDALAGLLKDAWDRHQQAQEAAEEAPPAPT